MEVREERKEPRRDLGGVFLMKGTTARAKALRLACAWRLGGAAQKPMWLEQSVARGGVEEKGSGMSSAQRGDATCPNSHSSKVTGRYSR